MTRLAALHARISGDSTGFVAAAGQADAAAKKLSGTLSDAPTGLGGRLKGTTAAFGRLTSAPGFRMLPVQLSQVAQQAAAGTSVLQALTIQAADIGLAFGAAGAIVGTLATIGVPLLIGAFSGASEEVQTLDDRMSALSDILGTVTAASDILAMSNFELAEQYGVLAGRVRELALEEIELALARQEAATAAAFQNEEMRAATEEYGNLRRSVNEFGDVTYEASEAIRAIMQDFDVTGSAAAELAQAFADFNNAPTFDAQRAALNQIKSILEANNIQLRDIPPELATAISNMNALEQATIDFSAAAAGAAANAAAIGAAVANIALPQTVGVPLSLGPGGAAALLPGQALLDGPDGPKRGGGGGGRARSQDSFEKDLERLREQLGAETELELQMNEERMTLLDEALNRELLTHEEYNALIEAERQRHHDKMSELDVYKYGTGLQQAETFFGAMATAFASGNEKMLQISKAFGAAEALINAWRTFSQVMADRSLPWFAKIPAAVSLLGSAMQAVSAIQGAGKGGGGQRSAGAAGGGGGGGGPAAPAGGSPMQQRSLTLIGDRFNRSQAIEIAQFMNDGTDDGLVIRGRR